MGLVGEEVGDGHPGALLAWASSGLVRDGEGGTLGAEGVGSSALGWTSGAELVDGDGVEAMASLVLIRGLLLSVYWFLVICPHRCN